MKTSLIKITVIHPDGREEAHECEISRDPGYKVLEGIIKPLLDGADFEHLYVRKNVEDAEVMDMFIDDIGRLKNLPMNHKATALYRNQIQHQLLVLQSLEDFFVVGKAVLFPKRVWF